MTHAAAEPPVGQVVARHWWGIGMSLGTGPSLTLLVWADLAICEHLEAHPSVVVDRKMGVRRLCNIVGLSKHAAYLDRLQLRRRSRRRRRRQRGAAMHIAIMLPSSRDKWEAPEPGPFFASDILVGGRGDGFIRAPEAVAAGRVF